MNIFALHPDPALAAQYHNNKHVVKMITESAQLLSTWVRHRHPDLVTESRLFKPTHINHPCNKWLRENDNHAIWLIRLMGHLIDEYDLRYPSLIGRVKHLKSRELYQCLADIFINPDEEFIIPKRFALAMPEDIAKSIWNDHDELWNSVVAYRVYYQQYKNSPELTRWKYRPKPYWWAYHYLPLN